MTDFETRLQKGLDADDEAFLKDLEQDVGLFQQMGAVFSGPLKFWTVYAFIMSFVMFGVAIWSLFQMFEAATAKETILWFALFSSTFLGVGLIKVWILMRMNHLAVLRELKMIELRLVKAG